MALAPMTQPCCRCLEVFLFLHVPPGPPSLQCSGKSCSRGSGSKCGCQKMKHRGNNTPLSPAATEIPKLTWGGEAQQTAHLDAPDHGILTGKSLHQVP